VLKIGLVCHSRLIFYVTECWILSQRFHKFVSNLFCAKVRTYTNAVYTQNIFKKIYFILETFPMTETFSHEQHIPRSFALSFFLIIWCHFLLSG